jgi:predicted Zn-dependent protease
VIRDELTAIAEAALGAADPGADVQLLARAWHERSLRAELAGSSYGTTEAAQRSGVEVLAIVDGHAARAADLGATPATAELAASRALAAAEALALAAGSGDHPGLPEPAVGRAHQAFDAATARLEGWHETLDSALAAPGSTRLDGHWEAGVVTTAMAATNGLSVTDATTDAELRLAVRAVQGAVATRLAPAASALDGAALAREALALAATGAAEPLAPTPTGTLPVVLGPDAVATLLALLGRTAFNGLLHAEGRGALAGRLGARIGAPAINLSDTPRLNGTLPRAFDAEGVPKAPIPLVQDGVAHRVVHDTRSAARAGGAARSTGHALAPGGSATGPEPRNLVLIGGGVSDDAELAAAIAHGVYVPRIEALALLDLASTAFTAVAPAARLIRGGTIGEPLAPSRIGGTALEMLARTEALTSRTRLAGWVERPPSTPRFAWGAVVPALRTHLQLG